MDVHIKMYEMQLIISRICNALYTPNINDFMVDIHIYKENNQRFEQTLGIFQNKYLTNVRDDSYSIIISNKNCKINGYCTNCLFKNIQQKQK